MINFNSSSRILVLIAILTFGALYFIGLAIPDRHEIIEFGYSTSFLVLIVGYILQQKKIQQLIGLFLYIVVYNLDLFKDHLFQIQNDDILYFARQNTFYATVLTFVFLFPTLFDKYKLMPLTNKADIKDATIIVTTITLTGLIQTLIRLTV